MSADNGIYILKSIHPSGEGFEYRVKEGQNIEDIWKYGSNPPVFDDVQVKRYFKGCEVVTDEESALDIAHLLGEDGYTEYGVCRIDYPKAFPK